MLYYSAETKALSLVKDENTPVLAMIQLPGRISKGSKMPTKSSSTKLGKNEKRVTELSKLHGITNILCLINKYEMRANGVDIEEYHESCRKNGIEFQQFEILEMKAPGVGPQDLDNLLLADLVTNML